MSKKTHNSSFIIHNSLERRLVRRLLDVVGETNQAAIVAIQETLDTMEWTNPQAPALLLRQIERQLRTLRDVVPDAVEPVLVQAVTDIYRAARVAQIADLTNKHRGLRPFASRGSGKTETSRGATGMASKGPLAPFGTRDKETVEQLQRVRRIVIRGGWAERLDNFSDRARTILLEGARQGMGRKALGRRLLQAFEHGPGGEPYWEIVGSAWLNTARNRANLQTFADAGVTHYRILAVADRRTTPICAGLDGTVFSVATQLAHEERATQATSLEELKQMSPWLTVRRGDTNTASSDKPSQAGERRQTVGIRQPGGGFIPVTQATLHSSVRLQRLGLGLPPYHARCRTTVVAAV